MKNPPAKHFSLDTRLEALCDILPDPMMIVDEAGLIVGSNTHAEKLFGYTRTELRGTKIELMLPDRFREKHIGHRERYRQTEYVRPMGAGIELVAQKKNGLEFPVEISLSPFVADGHHFVLSVVHDLTDRKKIESAHRESEDRYRSLVELSPEAILVHVRGTIVYANQEIARLFDAKGPEAVVGKSVLDFVPVEYREMIRQRMESTNTSREPYLVRGRRMDGEEFHLEVVAARIRMGGEPATLVVMRDITERVRGEEELRASQEQLRNLSTHLQSAREEERTTIAREIHDELGQALTALKLDVASLEDSFNFDDAAGKALALKTHHMSALIDETIQTVRRIATQLRPVLLDSLGLVPAIEWLVEDFQSRTGIACGLIVEPEDLETDKDRSTALYRILQEALTNVMRHARATMVTVRIRRHADAVVLEVRDNGIGIDQERMRQTKSFGLLGIRERARIFRGIVSISGEPGEGTTITVKLPI